MKSNLLRQVVTMSRRTLHGMILVYACSSVLIASDLNAQILSKSIQDIYLSVVAEDAPIKRVLKQIEGETGFSFAYNSQRVNLNRRLSLHFDESRLSDVLMDISKKSSLKFKRINNYIHIGKRDRNESIEVEEKIDYEDTRVTGQVTSVEDPEGLPGVNILVKGTKIGTVTDADGNYSLDVPGPETVLVFTSVGFITREFQVGTQTVINIVLEPDVTALDEIVVVGYGTSKKSDVTGALQVVKLEDVQAVPNSTFMESLQGMVPGLSVTMSEVHPGADPNILIRGENSLSASNNPLIVVDGFPYPGDFNQINSNDIESITVLKDISASAIYGARAANGVILITTKKGSSGKMRISYSGYFGVQQPEKLIDLHNGPQHMKKLEDVAKFIGRSYSDPEELLFQAEKEQFRNGIETDWQDLIFRTGFRQDHTVAMSGGNETTNYYTSIGVFDENGIVENSSFTRYNITANFSHSFNDWLEYKTNIQVSHTDLGGITPDRSLALKMSPYGKVFEEDGSYAFYPQFPEIFNHSPFANQGATKDETFNRVFIKQNLLISPTFAPGLTYDFSAGVTLIDYNLGEYYPSSTLRGQPLSGVAEINTSRNLNWIFQHLLLYKKSFGNHNLEATALYSREKFEDKGITINANGFVNDIVDYHYVQSASTQNSESLLSERAIESIMGRLNYNYNNLYYLTLTYRRDGYSGFAENDKYGSFPSIGIGYTISNASYFNKSGSTVNYLKLRASYGSAGNMAIEPYQTLDQYRTILYIFGDNSNATNGLVNNVIGNNTLGWETTTSFNIGVDFAILDSRLSGSIDLYRSNSSDLLMQRQVPVMNGYQSIWDNIGETKNKGIEIALNSVNIDKGTFRWTSSFTFYANRDEIVKLRGDGIDDIANSWFIGEPLRVYYDLNNIGVFDSQEEVDRLGAGSYGKPGLYIVEDVNQDGEISLDDRKIIASQNPDWVAGLLNTISFKNWQFGLQLYAVSGWVKPNGLVNPGVYLSEKQTNYPDISYWSEDNITAPFLNPGADIVIVQGGSHYMDASFLRIQNINAAYNFKSLVGLENVRLTFNVKNAYTFTDWLGYFPEATNTFAPFPSQRTFTLGINFGI